MSDDTGPVSRRTVLQSLGAAGALSVAGCTQSQGDGGGGGQNVEISGSSTVFPLATAMKEEFEKNHSATVSVSPTGTGGGFNNNFCPGNNDMNNASRQITDAEQQLCSENGVEPVEFQVATDALTVIVNNDADWVDCVTVDELAQIWTGENPASTWSDVNADWPDEPLELFGPTTASGTYDYFRETVLGEGASHRQDYSATEQDRQIVNGVQNSEYAIGYMGFAYYSENPDSVTALGIDDGGGCVEPSLETASSGEYSPLSRPLYTYAAKSALGEDHVAEFVRFWLENATSQELVANRVGYVPLTDSTQQEMLDKFESARPEEN